AETAKQMRIVKAIINALFGWIGKKPDAEPVPPAIPPGPVVSQRGIDCIKHFESCLKPIGGGRFEAYADPAHGWRVPTIGWGTIAYESGAPVKRGDIITQSRADHLLAW